MTTTELINNLNREAAQLEQRMRESALRGQLFEIAQTAAKSYHFLALRLMNKLEPIQIPEREQLIRLSQRFSLVENDAMRKFYRSPGQGPGGVLL